MNEKLKYADQLSDTPSELLKQAVADMDRLDRQQYTPISYEWHSDKNGETCEVCLGGAVLAGTLQWEPTYELGSLEHSTAELSDAEKELQNKLYALDNFRTGDCRNAVAYMGIPLQNSAVEQQLIAMKMGGVPLGGNFSSWKDWKKIRGYYETVAQKLEDLGL